MPQVVGGGGMAVPCRKDDESTSAPSAEFARSATTITTISLDVVKPVSDRRAYEFLTVGGDGDHLGVRFLLVSDPEAVFAAACLNMQAGYFDDPPEVPGFAHWLEHAVHLGSGRYPDDKDYKYFLSQHGGTSNASTGMVHTSYHFSVASPHLAGALDRMARFFIDPLLQRDSIIKEAENVHAEFSRNCNSDARKLLQLRRSAAGGLLAKFSTGNAATLLDGPAAAAAAGTAVGAAADVPAALAAFWRRRYLAGALCGCVVGPQPLSELRRLATESFAEVRLRAEDEAIRGDPRVSGSPTELTLPAVAAPPPETAAEAVSAAAEGMVGEEEGAVAAAAEAAVEKERKKEEERYAYDDMCGAGRLGRMFRVATQRELRQLEVIWYLPFGMMGDIRSKPWRWASHVLGHEGRGSLAALLRGAGLAQELSAGAFDEVRLGRGFMFWGVTLTLSEAGLRRAGDVMRLVFAAVRAMRALGEEQRRSVWGEVAAAAAARWHFQDRSPPLELARDAAQRLHYFGPELALSGNSLLYEYDGAALECFLSYITPANCNVYLSDSSFAGATSRVEQWYGAKYSEEPLNLLEEEELYDSGAAAVTGAAAEVDPAGSPEDSFRKLLSRLRLPQAPSWALPVDVSLVAEPAAATAAAAAEPAAVVGAAGAASAAAAGGASPAGASAEEAVEANAAAISRTAVPPPAPPVLLEDSGAVRLWHRTDVSFGVPKTHVYVHLITRAVYDSPASWVTSRLACRLMEELLQPDVYDAQLVGTTYGLSASETGLHMSLHGFSGVVAKLAGVVGAALAGVTLEQVQARYGLVHGKLLRSLRLWRHNNPAGHAEYGTEHVLQLPHWHVEESIAVLKGAAAPAAAQPPEAAPPAAAAAAAAAAAGPVAVWEFLRGLGRGMAMEVLVYGNSTEGQARALCEGLVGHLRPTGLGPDGWPATRILQLAAAPEAAALPQGLQEEEEEAERQQAEEAAHAGGREGGAEQGDAASAGPESGAGPVLLRYVPANPNPANTNSAVLFLCQIGEDDPSDVRPAVLLDLLAAVASKPAFHALRTVQRLGYVVALSKHRLGGTMGLAVRVQSPDRRPAALRAAVAEWLAGFGRELAELSPERLASFKASLTEKYLEPPRSLAEAAAQAWRPIRYRSYDFRKAPRKADALRELGLQDLIRFYELHASPSSATARVLCCELWGGPGARKAAAAGGAAGPGTEASGTGEAAAAVPAAAAGPAAGGASASQGAGAAGVPASGAAQRARGPGPGVGEAKGAGEGEGEIGEEGGGAGCVGAWRRLGSEDLPGLHRRLRHWCHSETLGVLRPLQRGAGAPAGAAAAEAEGRPPATGAAGAGAAAAERPSSAP